MIKFHTELAVSFGDLWPDVDTAVLVQALTVKVSSSLDAVALDLMNPPPLPMRFRALDEAAVTGIRYEAEPNRKHAIKNHLIARLQI